jgi:predicted PolB exonuclease-like 3'-5' exonuclease
MSVLAFDLECRLDADLIRRVHGWTGTDAELREALRRHQLEKTKGNSDFPKPLYWQVVGLGLATYANGGIKSKGEAGPGEEPLLRIFLDALAKRPKLISFNGSAYDLAVIRYRCMLHGIDARNLHLPGVFKQWERYDYRFGEMHCDLADVLSGYGASAKPSLHEAAVLCGLRGKGDITGAQIEEIADAGRWQEIAAYAEDDAVQTLLIWMRWDQTRGDGFTESDIKRASKDLEFAGTA